MKAVRFVLWLILFLGLYAGFFVLLQYKPSDFSRGFKEQCGLLRKLLNSEIQPKK